MEKFKKSKYIFVIGIGGSDLASKAVWDAITLHKKTDKKIYFLESPDEREYEEIENIVENEIKKLEDFVLIVVSKSGETAETLETFNKIFEIMSKMPFDTINERILIISTPNSTLWKIAEEKEAEKIEWEGNTGGRFSAFTVAHTTVLSIAGLDVENFIIGSKEIKEEETKHLARNIFDNYKNDFNILDFFIFNSELEDLGKWCRQLIAESISLITPTVSIGPVDLHSMLELYLGGPKNRFTIFILSLKENQNNINQTAFENVTDAYQKAGLPFIKYEMAEINEKELGSFMAFMMATTIELAKLLGVDPYDQPAVEEYKSEIRSTKSEIN
ncbi:MAG: hypothetical protein AAB672_00635 [Patescibacteria group bacterium]